MTANTGDHSPALTAAIRAGNEFAFEESFRLYRDRLYQYFFQKTGNPEDARDLVQNSFLRLWQYRASISTDFLLEQQLFHIARTVFIDHLRREHKMAKIRTLVSEQFTDGAATTDLQLIMDDKDRLERALVSLPETRRKVFHLNRVQGYSYREIAELLSISVKAADNNLSRAVRQIKKALVVVLLLFIH